MLNQFVIVGRIVNDLEVKETENGKKSVNVVVAVTRSYKNGNGEYETDFIPCILWDEVSENATKYCKKGDVVGIKGRLQSDNDNVKIFADKVTFLSSRREEEGV